MRAVIKRMPNGFKVRFNYRVSQNFIQILEQNSKVEKVNHYTVLVAAKDIEELKRILRDARTRYETESKSQVIEF